MGEILRDVGGHLEELQSTIIEAFSHFKELDIESRKLFTENCKHYSFTSISQVATSSFTSTSTLEYYSVCLEMTDSGVSVRLRQAITLDDLVLVKRILKANPSLLQNPAYNERANSSLHLAASLGLQDIVQYLVYLGHDVAPSTQTDGHSNTNRNHAISINTAGQTPLHLAAANLHTRVVEHLCQHFPGTIDRKDNEGQTPLLLAASGQPKSIAPVMVSQLPRPIVRPSEDITTISTLLKHGANVMAQDRGGNTCLHNACAFGNLKTLRILIEAGADPFCMNYTGWKPEFYSLTVQAEVYYRNLVAEIGKQRAEEARATIEKRGRGGGDIRLVSQDDDDDESSEDADSSTRRERADSARSYDTFQSANS